MFYLFIYFIVFPNIKKSQILNICTLRFSHTAGGSRILCGTFPVKTHFMAVAGDKTHWLPCLTKGCNPFLADSCLVAYSSLAGV